MHKLSRLESDMQFSLLPVIMAKFWFIDAPLGLLSYFSSLNSSFLRLFSVTILLKTFFQPIKNEYREGLVSFSVGMGMVVKTILLFLAFFLFLLLFGFECLFLFTFILLPFFSLALFVLPI